MNAKRTKPDIEKVFADGRLIDEAIREGVIARCRSTSAQVIPLQYGGMAK